MCQMKLDTRKVKPNEIRTGCNQPHFLTRDHAASVKLGTPDGRVQIDLDGHMIPDGFKLDPIKRRGKGNQGVGIWLTRSCVVLPSVLQFFLCHGLSPTASAKSRRS
jgi:hypothetical protein